LKRWGWFVGITLSMAGVPAGAQPVMGISGGVSSRVLHRGFHRGGSSLSIDGLLASTKRPVTLGVGGSIYRRPDIHFDGYVAATISGKLGERFSASAGVTGWAFGPDRPIYGSDQSSRWAGVELVLELARSYGRATTGLNIAYDPQENGGVATASISYLTELWPVLPTTFFAAAGANVSYHIEGVGLSEITIGGSMEHQTTTWYVVPHLGLTFAAQEAGRFYYGWVGLAVGRHG